MKKTIRIIIPVLMVIAILGCLGWYLFIYDCAFTRDLLLDGARHFERTGNHKIASTLYDLAYRQTADNEDVAIELAKYHIKSGNYTQAEHTLSMAIADGGNEDLYVALCDTYLRQDKILDAVNLLDNISNSVIKARLDAMRPAVPVPSVEPGFYSQYIHVNLSAQDSKIYATSSGDYPSVAKDEFSEPIKLHDGENTIYAVAVNNQGLVSHLAIYGYTVGGVIEKVDFKDPAIEKQIRTQLGVKEDAVLYTNDLWTITELTVPSDAADYHDLAKLAFLESLTIENGRAGQIENISGLANLTSLTIRDTEITSQELAMIGNLPVLDSLTLSGCGLSTTAGLEKAVNLRILDLSNNTIRNIAPLSSLKKITEIYLQRNVIADLNALTPMSELQKLDISFNTVSSLSPVAGLAKLTFLHASNNSIADLAKLDKLTQLEDLTLSYNTISDIHPLAECKKLKNLDISNNALTDISVLKDIAALQVLDCSKNQITALPAWSRDAAIVNLNASDNQITTLAPLKDLENINKIFVDRNPEISDVNMLSGCSRLVQVSAYGTKVTDATTLINLSIVVNYDPTKAA